MMSRRPHGKVPKSSKINSPLRGIDVTEKAVLERGMDFVALLGCSCWVIDVNAVARAAKARVA